MICFATIWVNLTIYPWNTFDYETYERAKIVCKTNPIYKYDTPCLKSFTKTGKMDYKVICGRKQPRETLND